MKQILTRTWLLRDLTQKEVDALWAVTLPLRVDPGTLLIEAGKPNDSLWIICDGKIAIGFPIVGPAKKEEKIVAELGEGDICGEMSWLDGQPASANTRALEHSQILRIRFSDFEKFLGKFPEAHIGVLRKFAINLSHRLRGK
jgi:CRP/FNR family cyclic AMP-dependent transcriptional regulator